MSSRAAPGHVPVAVVPEPPKGSDVFFASLCLQPDKRRALLAIDSFRREAQRLADGDEASARDEIGRWREDLDRLYAGGEAQTPAVARLGVCLERFSHSRESFGQILDGVEMDLGRMRYATWGGLDDYLRRSAAPVGTLWVEVLGHRQPASPDHAAELCVAVELIRILAHVGDDAHRDRIYLPAEDLERFGVREEDLLSRRPTGPFLAVMAFECIRAREIFFRAESLLPKDDRMSLFALEILARIAYRRLEGIERSAFDVLSRPVTVPSYRKSIVALSTWLKYRILGGS